LPEIRFCGAVVALPWWSREGQGTLL